MASGAERNRWCPTCGELLRPWVIGNQTIDGCDACGGTWFGGGVLQAVANLPDEPLEAIENEFQRGLGGAAGGGNEKCPDDRTKLIPHQFRAAPAVSVAACPTCHGLWLDEGQMHELGRRMPRHHGVAPATDDATRAAAMAAVAGHIRVIHCPQCDQRNPEIEQRCSQCGADLHLPLNGPEPLLSSHRLRWRFAVPGWAGLAIVLAVLYSRDQDRAGRNLLQMLEAPAWLYWLPLGLVLAAAGWWALRWLWKPWRIDCYSGGLVLHRLWSRRSIPWDAMHHLYVFDLGPRALWYPFCGSRPRRSWAASASLDDLPSDWGDGHPVALMIVISSRGVFTVGPDFDRYWELQDKIDDHFSDE